MSNYQRLISYIYAYEGGIKGKNIGFAKLETRNVQCKITVNVKKIFVGGNPMGVYLLSNQGEIRIGTLFSRNGAGEFRTTVNSANIEDTGRGIEEFYGLSVHDVESAWRAYTTIWEDAVAHAAEVELADVTSEKLLQKQEEKMGHIENTDSMDITDNMDNEEAAVRALPISREIEAELEAEDARMRRMPGTVEKEETAEKARIFFRTSSGEDKWIGSEPEWKREGSGVRESLMEAQASAAALSDTESRSGKPAPSAVRSRDAAFQIFTLEPEREEDAETAITEAARCEMPQPVPMRPEIVGPEMPQPGTGLPEMPQIGTGHPEMPQPVPMRPEIVRPETPEPEPSEPVRPEMPAHEPGAEMPASESGPEMPVREPGPEALRRPAWREAREQHSRGQEPRKQEPREQEPIGQEPLRSQPVREARPSEFIPLHKDDKETHTSQEMWEMLRKRFAKILAFDYEDGCEILTIKPQDIGLLPRDNWVFGNNSFLLHGYYNYRYLILARLENPDGEPRYLLGVPGNYYSNEKYMASMFGFPDFVLSKKQPSNDSRFGYWYSDVKIGE